MNVPEGYVLVPKEAYDMLVKAAQKTDVTGPNPPPVFVPFNTPIVKDFMPDCGCPVGSACANAACPHLAKVTCEAH